MRRCTVYQNQHWHVRTEPVKFEGWLVSVDPNTAYQHCVVADADGRLHSVYLSQVRLHVPVILDLLTGRPAAPTA